MLPESPSTTAPNRCLLPASHEVRGPPRGLAPHVPELFPVLSSPPDIFPNLEPDPPARSLTFRNPSPDLREPKLLQVPGCLGPVQVRLQLGTD